MRHSKGFELSYKFHNNLKLFIRLTREIRLPFLILCTLFEFSESLWKNHWSQNAHFESEFLISFFAQRASKFVKSKCRASSISYTQNFNSTDSNLVFGLRPPKKVRLFVTQKSLMFRYRLTKMNSSNSCTQRFNTTDSNLVFGLRLPKKVRFFVTQKERYVQVLAGWQKGALVTAIYTLIIDLKAKISLWCVTTWRKRPFVAENL